MTKRVMLTGAGGFVGSHVLRHLLENTDWNIVCPVTFRHRGNGDRIASSLKNPYAKLGQSRTRASDEWHRRVDVVMWDLTTPISPTLFSRIGNIDYVLNVASESHVDRSISDPVEFTRNNVDLILNVLEYCRRVRPTKILHMSTDEVYGPASATYKHVETDTLRPSNPYSASKAAQEAICYAYWRTYDLPIVVTNTMNIIGEMQDPEKFIMKTLRALIQGYPVVAHVSPTGVPGSRFYLHARNLADAWLFLLNLKTHEDFDDPNFPFIRYGDGRDMSRFNIVGEREVNNVEMVHMLARIINLKRDEYEVKEEDFHSSRPGHDLRYALDGSKLRTLGWNPPVGFDESLRRTVEWTLAHPEWLVH